MMTESNAVIVKPENGTSQATETSMMNAKPLSVPTIKATPDGEVFCAVCANCYPEASVYFHYPETNKIKLSHTICQHHLAIERRKLTQSPFGKDYYEDYYERPPAILIKNR